MSDTRLTELDHETMADIQDKARRYATGGPVFQSVASDYQWALATIRALANVEHRCG